MKTKYLVFIAIGAAVGLLLASDKGEEICEELAENAKKWKKKLDKLASNAGDQVSDLKKLVSKEIEGLGSDARDRILSILDEGTSTAKNVKGKVNKELS